MCKPNDLLVEAAAKGDAPGVSRLLGRGAWPDSYDGEDGRHALHKAVEGASRDRPDAARCRRVHQSARPRRRAPLQTATILGESHAEIVNLPRAHGGHLSKPFRDTSFGGGLDVTVTLPAPVVEKIREAAKERGEDPSGWCRATLIECVAGMALAEVAELTVGDLSLELRAALAEDPAMKDLDPLVMRAVAHRHATRLERARLLFFRKPRPPLHSAPRAGATSGAGACATRSTGRAACFNPIPTGRRNA